MIEEAKAFSIFLQAASSSNEAPKKEEEEDSSNKESGNEEAVKENAIATYSNDAELVANPLPSRLLCRLEAPGGEGGSAGGSDGGVDNLLPSRLLCRLEAPGGEGGVCWRLRRWCRQWPRREV